MAKVVSNRKQLEKLVLLMEANPDIAKGICGKAAAKKRWEKFTLELNSLGPPLRTCDKWIKVWADLKCKIKKKKTENKVEIQATGGGPNRLHTFSSLEESVIGLLSINASIDPPGLEFGQEKENDVNEPNIIIKQSTAQSSQAESSEVHLEDLPMTDLFLSGTNQIPLKKSDKNKTKNREANERIELLKKQINTLQEFCTETKSTLESVKKTVSNLEEYSRKNYYINKDILALKKKKLEMYKDDTQNRQKDRVAKLKLIQQKLEFQKSKVDLLLGRA